MKKFKKADVLHLVLGLVIFFCVWFGSQAINEDVNGIWFGFVAVLFVGFGKELNDKYGWFPFLLTDGETRTGIDGRDTIITVIIPSIIMVIVYAIRG